jgi:hypothetical protein
MKMLKQLMVAASAILFVQATHAGVLLKKVKIDSVSCKTVAGESLEDKPGQHLSPSFEVYVKVSYETVGEQYGDAHAPKEYLGIKETKEFTNMAFTSGSKENKAKYNKLKILCVRLHTARKKGAAVDILGTDNTIEDIRWY